jgi:hypothetical protein
MNFSHHRGDMHEDRSASNDAQVVSSGLYVGWKVRLEWKTSEVYPAVPLIIVKLVYSLIFTETY